MPVDADGHATAAAPIWMDRRATAESRALAAAMPGDRLRAVTGLNLDASHGAPKIAWLRANAPHADGYLVPAAYLVARLTGRRVMDPANASCLLLFDVANGGWSAPLLEALGLEAALLGEVRPATEVAGELQPAIAETLGLPERCRVAVGTGDEHAACVGAGVLRPGITADITGTAEPVAAAADRPLIDEQGLVETHAHVPPGRWLIENPGFVSAGSVRWLAEDVLGCAQTEIGDLAAGVPSGADGVLFLPALGGAVTPRWNDLARAGFTGLAIGHDRRHLARAVLEGCAFALRDIVERLAAMGLAGDRIRVVGGGARSRTWLQIKADVTGRSVEVATEPEATALGAALVAAVAAGWYRDLDEASAATLSLAEDTFQPDPAAIRVYDEAYARYRAAWDALEPTFAGAGA